MRLLLPVLALTGLGCPSGSGPIADGGPDSDGAVATCGPGLQPYKTACVPLLDDCPEGHAPVPGGGCKKVGVEPCTIHGGPGLKAPPDWTCRPVGARECTVNGGPGIRAPPDWTCQAIGPPRTCKPGFAPDSRGWCEPVLPQGKCPDGMMEVIGQTECQPVGECGSGTWGAVSTTAGTIHVNPAHSGKNPDGSPLEPYPTLQAALQAAPAGGHIVVASGTYAGDLHIRRSVTIEGRCAQMVKVVGQGDVAAITVEQGEATLRGLTVTGPASGILVNGPGKATLEELVVQGTQYVGVAAQDGATVTVRGVLVQGAHYCGVAANSAQLRLERCTVRGSLPDASGMAGGVGSASYLDKPAKLEVADCVILDNWGSGISVFSGAVAPCTALIERSVVRGTQKHSPTEVWKNGVNVIGAPGNVATVVLRDSLLADNRGNTFNAGRADLTIERTVIRDGLPRVAGDSQGNGHGLVLGNDTRLALKDSRIAGHPGSNILLWRSDAEVQIERSVIEEARLNAVVGWGGHGIIAYRGDGASSSVTLKRSLLARNLTGGLELRGTEATVEGSVIRDTLGNPASGHNGSAVFAVFDREPARLTLRDSLLANNRYIGVWVMHSVAAVERSIVRDTRPRELDNSWGCGLAASPDEDAPGKPLSKLAVSDSIVSRNTVIGVTGAEAILRLDRTLVHRTLPGLAWIPDTGLTRDGAGVHAGSWSAGDNATLTLQDSTVTDNHGAAVLVYNAPTRIERSVVSRTRAADALRPGAGIIASGTRVTLRDSHVSRNRYVGVGLFNSTGEVARTAVSDTAGGVDMEGNPSAGVGIYSGPAGTSKEDEPAGTLDLRDSMVARSRGAGLLAVSSGATVRGCVVRDTMSSSVGEGDGVVGDVAPGWGSLDLDVQDSLVDASSRANLYFFGGGGRLRRSVLSDGTFAVVVDGAASPEIGPDNVFEGNTENRVSFGQNLAAPPMPVLPPAPGSQP